MKNGKPATVGTCPFCGTTTSVESTVHLRFGDALAAKVRREYEAAFYPADAEWRTAALEQSREFIDRGVSGISSS